MRRQIYWPFVLYFDKWKIMLCEDGRMLNLKVIKANQSHSVWWWHTHTHTKTLVKLVVLVFDFLSQSHLLLRSATQLLFVYFEVSYCAVTKRLKARNQRRSWVNFSLSVKLKFVFAVWKMSRQPLLPSGCYLGDIKFYITFKCQVSWKHANQTKKVKFSSL